MEKGIPSDMYREHILELYKSPSNFGILKKPTHEKTSYNSVCGDEVTVQLLVKDDIIKDIKFSGSGCVISMVASSLLTDKIKGMKVSDVKNMKAEEVLNLLDMKLNLARVKCALLSFEAVKGALR
ncbi:MAG: iron-sulfur cluster assembly scaffold protein [Nanoarchaeota archaeon]|nr:iron-sulfur cluster assembly scaffold protein [Nanoarchaeota archaeon]